MLHNLRFLNGLKDFKASFRLKKIHEKILFLLIVITQKRFIAYYYLIVKLAESFNYSLKVLSANASDIKYFALMPFSLKINNRKFDN